MLEKCPLLKNATLLVLFMKIFCGSENLVNNRIIDQLKKCGPFSDFQYGFRSSQSTADVLTVVSDRIERHLTGLGLLGL